jgi:endonuclease YncB( thermonuclease family)
MGNYISATPESASTTMADKASSVIQQLYMTYCINCCMSVPEEHIETKDKYQNYTDEITMSPTHKGTLHLKSVYHPCTSENTPSYGYENLKKMVKILKVIDGDTVDIALHYEDTGKIFKHRVRMYGLDTPESRPSLSNPDRLKEIEAAKKAKEALIQRFQENDYLVVAQFYKFDKYGRLMATFYDKQGEDINKWMISSGHAEEYFGKTKKKFVERPPLMVSECDHEYFETPRTSEQSEESIKEVPKEQKEQKEEDDFEEFPETITEVAKNNIRIV